MCPNVCVPLQRVLLGEYTFILLLEIFQELVLGTCLEACGLLLGFFSQWGQSFDLGT